MKLRFGILSTASIVPRFLKAARETDELQVTALASRNLEKAREKAKEWDIPLAFGSYEELLRAPEIDAVYIATINNHHGRYARQALEAGKHVLCEKPFVTSEEEVHQLFALAREKGLFLMEAQKAVFLPAIQKAKELIKSGALGRVGMIEFSSPIDPGYNKWQFDPEKFGGPLYGNCVYSVEISQFLFDCAAIRCAGLRTTGSTTVEDQFSGVLLLENGVLFTNRCSTRVDIRHTAVIYGEKGSIEIPAYWRARDLILRRPGCDPEIFSYPCAHELVYEVRHVAACIRAGCVTSPVMTEEMTARAIRTLRSLDQAFQ